MGMDFLLQLEQIIEKRKSADADTSYTKSLFDKGLDKILEKVGEESVEFIIDSKNNAANRTCEEAADLLYHLMVALQAQGLSLQDVVRILEARHSKEG